MSKKETAFAGFFLADGMIRISRDKRGGSNVPWYRQVARITLRQDDEKVLDWIKDNFGGHIFSRGIRNSIKNKKTGEISYSNPVTIWQAEDLDTCKNICKILLMCPIPSKKKEEAKLFLEYAKLKIAKYVRGKGYDIDTLKKFEWYHQGLKDLKRYKERT